MNSRPHTFRDELDDTVVPILRTMTPAEKIAKVASCDRVARMLEAAGLRLRHPDWSEEQIHKAIVARRLNSHRQNSGNRFARDFDRIDMA